MSAEDRKLIFASALGTAFEWYDFYLYGSLASVIARQFFGALDPTASYVCALLAFAAGFLVRPLGALMFGRLGDLIGRKHTFIVTILIMGTATFAVGLLPSYRDIGIAAPVLLVGLRMLQGLALGGEYGGAVIYVAESAPPGRRGAYTGWIQATATLGLLLSLVVILLCRHFLGAAFDVWGWRLPFVLSGVLLVVSVYLRMRMKESPAFTRMKAQGKASRAPLTEAFGRWSNLRRIVVALLGLTAGQAVVWYCGQFYALFFLTHVAKVDVTTAQLLMACALLLGAPFFVLFGSLSDRVGRKPLIMAGFVLALFSYLGLFPLLLRYANPDLVQAQQRVAVTVSADARQCSFQGNPIARNVDFTSSCDIAKRTLTDLAIPYQNVAAPAGSLAAIRIGDQTLPSLTGRLNERGDAFSTVSSLEIDAFRHRVRFASERAGLTQAADCARMNLPMVLLILFYLVLLVAMVYGPIAATLVELFPTRIRYTSLSLPYHFGNGWFGGLLPSMAFAMVAATGDIFYGLWYPVSVAGLSFIIGVLYIPETRDVDIYARDHD